MLTRRGLLGGIGALLAAPAIVRVSSIMPVRAFSADEMPLALMRDVNGLIPYNVEYTSTFEEQYALLRECKEEIYRTCGLTAEQMFPIRPVLLPGSAAER